MGGGAPQILRPRGPAYYAPHDTAQTHAHWAGNPAASSALADSCAARACDARVQRRLNPPDDPPPSASECHTGNAGWSAPRDERHPTTGNPTRCTTPQPDSPHGEQHAKRAPVEPRGRAHHPEPHLTIPLRLARYACNPPPPAKQVEANATPQYSSWKRTSGPRSPRRRGSSLLETSSTRPVCRSSQSAGRSARNPHTASRRGILESRLRGQYGG